MLLPAPHGVAGVTDGGLAVTILLGNKSVKDTLVIGITSLLVTVILMLAIPVAGLKIKLLTMVGVLTISDAEAGAALLPALVVVTAPAVMVLT